MNRIQVIVFIILKKINSLRAFGVWGSGFWTELMLKLLSHAEEWAVMQTWHPRLLPFTGSSRPPGPRGPALMSPALRDYTDSCWSEQASRTSTAVWGRTQGLGVLMRKIVRNRNLIPDLLCEPNALQRTYKPGGKMTETKELHEKLIIQFAFCHLNRMN